MKLERGIKEGANNRGREQDARKPGRKGLRRM